MQAKFDGQSISSNSEEKLIPRTTAHTKASSAENNSIHV